MGLNKSRGNMYDWVTHTWSPIVGCSHQCSYCYVKSFRDLPVKPKLVGPFPPLGEGRTIFVGHMCDMWCRETDRDDIVRVLEHCRAFPKNKYVFQTKNPGRVIIEDHLLPDSLLIGTTLETNRSLLALKFSKAPDPINRAAALTHLDCPTFITIEPILDFDLEPFLEMIRTCHPSFVNIGADSKGHKLPEPSAFKVSNLIYRLGVGGIEVKKKSNLERLL